MPVYDYKCQEHGIFHELATIDDAAEPMPCPHCKELAPRILMVPPEILDMAPEKRKAIERNEKAQHEPKMSTKESRAEDEERRKFEEKLHKHHHKGCGCGGHHKKKASKLMWTANGEKMFPSMRPWMISH
ncbi:zinc ribbon domain-containing protein [Thiomicrorhabdus sp. 6S3-12]|uniref:zinc ribbon domain-containing protein n=1 Tax=Thiomicrorhabdus sp. 6S3-12 TaxID=2819681 RepID=UPI001AADB0B1|nr:zinc ribbon domain-containing protein [Thiomicrorhabdus sp. 6S3-12]MBO1923059.1 zinc ribbon domain-containing protein [Thiomicrorhabdus sp. 6S3-12]